MSRDLSEVDYVYVWVDGVHFSIRLEDARLVPSSSWVSAPTARRMSVRLLPTRGRRCFTTCDAGACGHRCSPSATVRSDFGRRRGRSSPRRRSNAIGCTRDSMFFPLAWPHTRARQEDARRDALGAPEDNEPDRGPPSRRCARNA